MIFSDADSVFELNDGGRIPCIGFGTFGLDKKKGASIVSEAIKSGYRHFDTASLYGTEDLLAEGIKKSGIKREELYLTSKVWKDDLSPLDIRKSLDNSLHHLNTDYLDLLLIHWPRKDKSDQDWEEHLSLAWDTFVFLRKEGKVKSVGVSNFLPHHFDVLENSEKPCVNQIEFHPGYMQTGAVDYCQRHSIVVEAWSPLGRGVLLNHPDVVKVSRNHSCSPSAVLIKFCLQHNVLPLVKSSDPQRIRENLQVFDDDLSEDELNLLRAIEEQTGWSGQHPDLNIPSAKIGDF